MCISTPRKTS